MRLKCKSIVIIVFAIMLALVFIAIYKQSPREHKNYSAELISVLSKQEQTTVQDVFSFSFDRAYIFNDCYISGEGFQQEYNLEISIPEVKSGTSENVQRIVFVNEAGDFVYEFKCDMSEVFFEQKGIVIYPETVIERKSSIQAKTMIIDFHGSELQKKTD